MIPVDDLQEIWNAFDFTYILGLLESIVPSLICISIHELCHGLTAYALGDDTAKNAGRLTVNPLKHIDIMGLLMTVVFRIGWAKPVPVNMLKFKNPKRGMAITALAGPASNMFLAVIFLFLYGGLLIPFGNNAAGIFFLNMLLTGSYISIGLAVFNMIPVPPLDGAKILFSFLSDSAYYVVLKYEKYFSLVLIVLVATGILGKPITQIVRSVFEFMFPLAEISFKFVSGFIHG